MLKNPIIVSSIQIRHFNWLEILFLIINDKAIEAIGNNATVRKHKLYAKLEGKNPWILGMAGRSIVSLYIVIKRVEPKIALVNQDDLEIESLSRCNSFLVPLSGLNMSIKIISHSLT